MMCVGYYAFWLYWVCDLSVLRNRVYLRSRDNLGALSATLHPNQAKLRSIVKFKSSSNEAKKNSKQAVIVHKLTERVDIDVIYFLCCSHT